MISNLAGNLEYIIENRNNLFRIYGLIDRLADHVIIHACDQQVKSRPRLLTPTPSSGVFNVSVSSHRLGYPFHGSIKGKEEGMHSVIISPTQMIDLLYWPA